MKIHERSKEELLKEISDLRSRISELESRRTKNTGVNESLQESEEKYRSLVDSTDDSIYLVDRQSRYIYMNKKHLSRLSLLGNEFLGRPYGEFHMQKETKNFIKKVDQVFKTGKSAFYEYKSFRDNRYFFQTFSPVRDPGGEISAVTVVSKDVTEQKKAQELILQSKQDWENTFNTITDMITIHDKDFNVIRANKAADKILGLPFLMPETKCYKYYHGQESPLQGCPSCECIESGTPISFDMFEPYLNMYLEIRAIPRYDNNNNLVGLIHIVRDITERKKMDERLRTMSMTDELTGLLNRRGFFSYAGKQLKIAERAKRAMSVIYADLDGLKKINDTWGHKEGDEVLLEAAHVLRDTFRESDVISRLGGDEFAVLVEVSASNDELIVKERLEESINRINSRESRRYKLHMSVGMVRFDPEHPCSVDELLSRSDKLMYADKKSKE